jgi:hypothetical protein
MLRLRLLLLDRLRLLLRLLLRDRDRDRGSALPQCLRVMLYATAAACAWDANRPCFHSCMVLAILRRSMASHLERDRICLYRRGDLLLERERLRRGMVFSLCTYFITRWQRGLQPVGPRLLRRRVPQAQASRSCTTQHQGGRAQAAYVRPQRAPCAANTRASPVALAKLHTARQQLTLATTCRPAKSQTPRSFFWEEEGGCCANYILSLYFLWPPP